MGTDEKPRRCASVDTNKWRRQRYSAGCARSVETSRALYADYGFVFEIRPGLRKDFAALLRASGSVRGRVCAGVVQADAPRHGSDRALPWSARSEGDPEIGRASCRERV